ncbi:MAG: tandem-95 repeat protein, partial [Acidobacteria bacterium]|nr:tandem-95 repeat protein [Acidobacteriota bacterium]
VAAFATGISPGPANEAAQVLTFNVTNNNNALFSAQPDIDEVTGNLTYTSALNANGLATVSVILMDDGSTANGGVDTSAAQMFIINVTPVNDAPVAANDIFTASQDTPLNVAAPGVLVNDNDADGDPLMVDLTSVTMPANGTLMMNADGSFTYTPNTGFTGPDSFMYEATDGTANSAAATVTINVFANQPPTAVDDTGMMNEDGAPLTILVLANDSDPENDPLMVTAVTQPANGMATFTANDVTYTPNPDFNGMDMFTYDVSDGISTSTANVTVTVNPVNDAPLFTAGPDQTVLEDSGAQTVAGWATGIAPGPPTATDEAGQTLTFNVTNSNNALFSVQPDVDEATGNLTYTPAANAFGSATVTVVLMDDGGTANGGVDTSAAQMFMINVTGVNDEPSFTAGPNQTALASSGAQSVSGWATAISAGPANESGQTLTFNVTNTNNALFSAQPAVSSTGTLTFTPAAPPTSGVATVSVTLMDNGGTANGGDDTSATSMFTITVNDFALTGNCTSGSPPCTGTTTATINAGQSVMFDINATAMQSAVMQTVDFSCANLPFGAACNFSPASLSNVPLSPGTTVMLTVTTTAPTPGAFFGQAAPLRPWPAPLYAFWLSIPGLAAFGLVLAGRSSNKRGVGALCLLALLLLMAGLLGACGNAAPTDMAMPGTPTGPNTITITATAGSSMRTVDVVVTVQ